VSACEYSLIFFTLTHFGLNRGVEVPNRLNYLLWLQDVVDASGLGEGSGERVVGLDMYASLHSEDLCETSRLTPFTHSGIGASAIYPLLGCKLCPSWSFVGTGMHILPFANPKMACSSPYI
jgi:23S rRNA A1618 N6-methylase RlmF